jgi:hypothetical protein
VSEVPSLENLDLTLSFTKDLHAPTSQAFANLKWLSADRKVDFRQGTEGWYATPHNGNLRSAMEQYGLTHINPPFFPTLKEARAAVQEVASQSGISLTSKLMRAGQPLYQIGSLPLNVYRTRRSPALWRIERTPAQQLPVEISAIFPKGGEEFIEACAEAGLLSEAYSSRVRAIQAVRELVEKHFDNAQTKV